MTPVFTLGLLLEFSDSPLRYVPGLPYLKHPCHFSRASNSHYLALPCTLIMASFKDRVLPLTVADILCLLSYTKSCSKLLYIKQKKIIIIFSKSCSWKWGSWVVLESHGSECHHAVSSINAGDKAPCSQPNGALHLLSVQFNKSLLISAFIIRRPCSHLQFL